MDNAVIITLIVCITLVLLCFINSWEKAQARKDVMKKVKKFSDAFGDIKPKKVETKKEDETPLKFGDE